MLLLLAAKYYLRDLPVEIIQAFTKSPRLWGLATQVLIISANKQGV